ncbi:MAG: sodium/solute symporter [Candidatus Aminicenantes bacterium]|nr:sodium/solute symporter [Candidatus Aminicenantes bacterium]
MREILVQNIDIFLIIVYLLSIFIFGLLFKEYVKSTEDYFLAGRALPWWVIGMSIIGTNIGAYDYVGAAGGAYRFGIAQANYEWLGAIPAMIISALVIVPYYWKNKVYTVPEFLGKRYKESVRVIEAVIYGVFLIMLLGIFFWASGIMLHTYVGWSIGFSIVLTAIVVGVYTISGGLAAVAITDVVQLGIMFVGGFAVAAVGFIKAGGVFNFFKALKAAHPQHLNLFLPLNNPAYPWLGMILGLGLVLSPAWWCANQSIIQRALGAKTEWDAKAGMMFAAFPKTLIPILVVLPGFFALMFAPAGAIKNPDQALPWVVKNFLPPGLGGLVFVAFIAALHSSVDSTLNSAATLWTRDIYQKYIKKNASDSHYLIVGRVLTFAFIIFGVVFAPFTDKFPGIYVAMQTLLSFFQGPTLATLLLGVLWWRSTGWGGFWGLSIGVLSAIGLSVLKVNFLYVAWWSFVISLIVNVVVSYLTPPEPPEKLRGLVYGYLEKDENFKAAVERRING